MVIGSATIKRAFLPALGTAAVVVLLGSAISSGAQEHGDHEHEHPSTTAAPAPTTAPPTTAAPTTAPPTTAAPAPTPQPSTPPTTTAPPTTPPTTALPRTPGAQTSTLRYGPMTIPGTTGGETGSHAHASTGNVISLLAQKPCGDCFITGMTANLVYPDGREANQSTGAMLHHMVLWNFGTFDATCSVSLLGFLGERFFASGDERTPVELPAGYGYYTSSLNPWNLVYELAGTLPEAQTVFIEMEYEYVPAAAAQAAGVVAADPVWLDIVPCLFSQYPAPAGKSSAKVSWPVNRPGKLITVGGHLHDGGVNIDIRNDSTGKQLCNSVARYGEPGYVDHHGMAHLSSMTGCIGAKDRPIDTLTSGQSVSITANYDLAEPASDVMGIVIMYVARS